MVLEVMFQCGNSDAALLHPTSEQRKWDLHEGHLPHIGEAMTIFNEAWSATSRETVI